MATTFTECEASVRDIAHSLMQKYHPDLLTADVTIAYWWAENENGNALKHHGYPSAATVKINSYANRVEGMTDATIKINRSWWEEHTEDDDRIALIDHELHHLIVKKDKNGKVCTDNCSRPKLVMRQHCFQIGGFHVIARRHGFSAEEVRAVLGVRRYWVQEKFDFGDAGDDRGAA